MREHSAAVAGRDARVQRGGGGGLARVREMAVTGEVVCKEVEVGAVCRGVRFPYIGKGLVPGIDKGCCVISTLQLPS